MDEQKTWSLHRQPKDCMGGDVYEYSIWHGDRIVLMADIAPNPLNSQNTLEDIVLFCNNHDRLTRENEQLRQQLSEAMKLLDKTMKDWSESNRGISEALNG